MVPLSDLLAAQSEAKMNKEETQTKVKDLAWLQGQLSKAQEQVNDARLEAAKLRADMSCMVQRSDLEDAKAQVKTLDEAQRNEAQQHRALLSELQERIAMLEHEKREILTEKQKMVPSSILIASRSISDSCDVRRMGGEADAWPCLPLGPGRRRRPCRSNTRSFSSR